METFTVSFYTQAEHKIPDADLRIMLSNAVRNCTTLHSVKLVTDRVARETGTTQSFREYLDCLLPVARETDTQHDQQVSRPITPNSMVHFSEEQEVTFDLADSVDFAHVI